MEITDKLIKIKNDVYTFGPIHTIGYLLLKYLLTILWYLSH